MNKSTKSELRKTHRANCGIQACASLLGAHEDNKGILPDTPSTFINLDAVDALGLITAIEMCARVMSETFERPISLGDVGYWDEYDPGTRDQALAYAELRSGAVDFEQFQRKTGGAK